MTITQLLASKSQAITNTKNLANEPAFVSKKSVTSIPFTKFGQVKHLTDYVRKGLLSKNWPAIDLIVLEELLTNAPFNANERIKVSYTNESAPLNVPEIGIIGSYRIFLNDKGVEAPFVKEIVLYRSYRLENLAKIKNDFPMLVDDVAIKISKFLGNIQEFAIYRFDDPYKFYTEIKFRMKFGNNIQFFGQSDIPSIEGIPDFDIENLLFACGKAAIWAYVPDNLKNSI